MLNQIVHRLTTYIKLISNTKFMLIQILHGWPLNTISIRYLISTIHKWTKDYKVMKQSRLTTQRAKQHKQMMDPPYG